MEPARRPRLSLSRRRPPEPEPEPRAPPAGPWTPREHERPWSALLRVASAELGADGACPPLPARPGRESRAAPSSLRPPQERARAPEVFSVGRETFTWLPLPPRGSAELPPALTQLDVDGHLAQCLAGGTMAEM